MSSHATRPCVHPDCTGSQSLVPNIDRSWADPASNRKWECDLVSGHVDEDPATMPRDRSRSITGR
jgi:hypothetical protein